jgi:predicted metal-binding membrane protein
LEGLNARGAAPGPTAAASRARISLVAALLVVAVVAWLAVALFRPATEDDERMLTMGMGFWLFLGTWSLMMAAMMLPTVSPMVDAFVRVQLNRRAAGSPYVSTLAFVSGYLLVWCSVGVVAFVLAHWLEDAAMDREWLMENGARLGGLLIAAAGVYQLSPLKRICLRRCRTPMSFVATSWRDGGIGAVQMGVKHGAYCLGCCWLLFAILFPLGIMNIAIMAAVTALIVVEKVLPEGVRAALVAGVLLIGYGALVMAVPDALPGLM